MTSNRKKMHEEIVWFLKKMSFFGAELATSFVPNCDSILNRSTLEVLMRKTNPLM
jgi:hypothetical protein